MYIFTPTIQYTNVHYFQQNRITNISYLPTISLGHKKYYYVKRFNGKLAEMKMPSEVGMETGGILKQCSSFFVTSSHSKLPYNAFNGMS